MVKSSPLCLMTIPGRRSLAFMREIPQMEWDGAYSRGETNGVGSHSTPKKHCCIFLPVRQLPLKFHARAAGGELLVGPHAQGPEMCWPICIGEHEGQGVFPSGSE